MIIGVGNKDRSINHDAGGAVIKFQLNLEKYDEIITKLGYKADFNE